MRDSDLRSSPSLCFTNVHHRQSGHEEGHELGFHGLEIISENAHQDVDHFGQVGADDPRIAAAKQRLDLISGWFAKKSSH